MDSDNRRANPTMTPDAVKALMMLRSEMTQREARMSASFNEQMQSLREEVGRFRSDIAGIVGGAGTQIAKEAKDAVSPVATEYGRAVSATSAHLRGASRTVWLWYGAAGSILLLVLLVAWAVLGHYRGELAAVQDELRRYENAVPVVQAFYASDAILCDGLICANADPDAKPQGDRRQYRRAKPRSQPTR
ncbi:hypothetical protein [Marilutibacter chinensis]|uniref:Uncharacterized protein n=1 Tax=Marilutibacter chinensis TaxID=2912247 RepID=A0ABS9HWN7_9GAMM|nr:hypothetical protein [Lysobacter chinensis]MCF7222575.1 hypothetical protein [Lysobacter chinensis]